MKPYVPIAQPQTPPTHHHRVSVLYASPPLPSSGIILKQIPDITAFVLTYLNKGSLSLSNYNIITIPKPRCERFLNIIEYSVF